MQSLICKECGKEKPVKDFTKDINSKTGYRSKCKECRNKKDRKVYHQEHSKNTYEEIKPTYRKPVQTIKHCCDGCEFKTLKYDNTVYCIKHLKDGFPIVNTSIRECSKVYFHRHNLLYYDMKLKVSCK